MSDDQITVSDILDDINGLEEQIDSLKDQIPDQEQIEHLSHQTTADDFHHWLSESCDSETCNDIREMMDEAGIDVPATEDDEPEADDESDADAGEDEGPEEPEDDETEDEPLNAAFPDEL